MTGEVEKRVRLDRWLNAARLFPSRPRASEACDGGKVEVNGQTAKPHKLIGPGDLLVVTTHCGKRTVCIEGLADRRQSPPRARELYDDRTPAEPPRPPRVDRERGAGRPTKRERRELEKLRGG